MRRKRQGQKKWMIKKIEKAITRTTVIGANTY